MLMIWQLIRLRELQPHLKEEDIISGFWQPIRLRQLQRMIPGWESTMESPGNLYVYANCNGNVIDYYINDIPWQPIRLRQLQPDRYAIQGLSELWQPIRLRQLQLPSLHAM